MTSFDAQHPRTGGSGPDRTRFTNRTWAEPGLGLAAPAALDLPASGFRGAYSRHPDTRPGDWAPFGEYESLDFAVQTVMDGPLSRGVANKQAREALTAWHDYAHGQAGGEPEDDAAQFAAGIRSGALAMYEHHLTGPDGQPVRLEMHVPSVPEVLEPVLAVAARKRASGLGLERWRHALQHAPSDAWQRGHLAAGIILSGADQWWGMRENPDAAIAGRH